MMEIKTVNNSPKLKFEKLKGGLKKMEKKYMTFGLLGLFFMALVSAGLIDYYGHSTQEIKIELPVKLTGELSNPIDGFAGQVVEGDELKMTNNADFSVLMEILDNSDKPRHKGINTSYKGNLELTKKNTTTWESFNDKVQIEYTVVGDKFEAEVVDGDEEEGYVLIYYADGADRFNNVSKAVYVEDVDANLPYAGDENAEGGENDYCATGEYATCHGAKIWYIPSDAINSNGDITWSMMNDFYFESSLIQYHEEGEIVVYPSEELDFTPEFDVSLFFNGTAEITTKVRPATA